MIEALFSRFCGMIVRMFICSFVIGSVLLFILVRFDLIFWQQVVIGLVCLGLCNFLCNSIEKHFLTLPTRSWYVWLIILILLILVFIWQVGRPSFVSGISMSPTFRDGDLTFAVKIHDTDSIKPGDIIVFDHNGSYYVKRVLATPGQTTVLDTLRSVPKVTLGEDEFYVTGDNYHNSLDSRYFGPIKSDTILYRVLPSLPFIYLFFNLYMFIHCFYGYFIRISGWKTDEEFDAEEDEADCED